VGREQEIGLLHERWRQAREGLGQVVVLSGEAGIGKSRLVQALTEHLAEDEHTRLECHCSPYAQQSALYPVIEQLQRRLQWRQETTPQEKLHTLEAALALSGLALDAVVPLLATLLALPLPAHYPPLTLEPQRQKQKTFEAIVAWWLKEAERQPVCLIVEDLHWVDPSTLELLSLLIAQVPTAPMLVLLLSRPEFHPPWPPRSYLLHLVLNRLSRSQVETMVAHLTGGKALPVEVHRQLVATTDGVPLFAEEVTRMVLETGLVKECEGHYELTGPLLPVAIPATLHDSLMARLDRLSAGKRVAQLGAVIGRQFAYTLLRAVVPWEEATLQRAIGQLVEAELLYPHGYPPEATYQFKHALIQEAAYQSLLKRTRQQYHQRIAQELAEHFPETVEAQPELLAHHYTEAGLSEQAVPWLQRAGQRALQHSAQTEAIRHFTKGLELLTTLPDTRKRLQHELAIQTSLGTALMVNKGFGHPEVEHTYARAWALCQQAGPAPASLGTRQAPLDRGPAEWRPRPPAPGPPCPLDHCI
jgi:predicted ATPase